jgi:uncharacterized membrane protein YoaK (UPF0700 family)
VSDGGGPRRTGLSIGLSALAGYVDAIGYLQLNGTFVSFMSGNTTITGISLAGHADVAAGLAVGLIALFVTGVVLANLVRRAMPGLPQLAVMVLVTLLLLVACLLQLGGATLVAMHIVALTMGAQNGVFAREGGVAIPLTYMTGTLVKVGDHIAEALVGGPAWNWVVPALRWCGLLVGAVVGAMAFHNVGADALWVALMVMAGVAVFTGVRGEI